MASQSKTPRGRSETATGAGRAPAEVSGAEVGQPRRAERRPEMVRQRREERRHAYEKQRRQWLITRVAFAVVGLLVVGGLAFGIYRWNRDQQLNTVPDGVQNFQYAGSDHTGSLEETVAYEESPPVGGRHAPSPYWQNCGFYDGPIQNESAVHSMEHGAVWITYRPDLPAEQIEVLRGKAEQSYILVSAYEDQEAPVVASSWNHQLELEGAEDERLDQFIRSFREGPDTPERGAVCSGGVGTPL